jgi:hypothetical protein
MCILFYVLQKNFVVESKVQEIAEQKGKKSTQKLHQVKIIVLV